MNFLYRKKFLKDLSSLPKDYQDRIEDLVFDKIPLSQNLFSEHQIIQLTGYKGFYKIRVGNYRIGIQLEKDNIIFERVLHRKDIYKFFP